jgi:hypothetical protein
MICNHAHQKLFPFIIACPHSLLLLPISPPSNWYVVKLPTSELSPYDWYVAKLPTTNSEPLSGTLIWYDVKLHVLDPSQLDHSLLVPLSLVLHHVHRRHQ